MASRAVGLAEADPFATCRTVGLANAESLFAAIPVLAIGYRLFPRPPRRSPFARLTSLALCACTKGVPY